MTRLLALLLLPTRLRLPPILPLPLSPMLTRLPRTALLTLPTLLLPTLALPRTLLLLPTPTLALASLKWSRTLSRRGGRRLWRTAL